MPKAKSKPAIKKNRRSLLSRRPKFGRPGIVVVLGVLAVAIGIYVAVMPKGAANQQAHAGTKDCRYGTRCYFWANINKDIAYNVINWRIVHGLSIYPNLADCEFRSAYYWSQVQASQNRSFHSDVLALWNHFCGVNYQQLGETLLGAPPYALPSCSAYDIVNCPGQIVQYWKNSAQHNAIMLNPAFNTMGFGTVQAANGNWYVTGEYAQVVP